MFRFVVFGLFFRHINQKKGECFKDCFFGQHIAVEELNRIFRIIFRLVFKTGVMPTKILFFFWIGAHHYIGGVRRDMEKGELEYFIPVIPVRVLYYRIVHSLIFFVFQFDGDNGQTI